MLLACRSLRNVRFYSYRSRQAVPMGNVEQFQEVLNEGMKQGSILPPLEQLKIRNYIPMILSENIQTNKESIYFGARKKQDQTDVAVEIKFNVIEAEWLNDDIKRKLYKYNLDRQVIDMNGDLVIRKEDSQYQMKNLKLALKELEVLIKNCETENWSRRVDGHRERQNVRKESIKTFRSLSWLSDPNFS